MPTGAADDRRDWLQLTLLSGIGGETQRALLRAFGAPETVFAATPTQLAAAIGDAAARRFATARADDSRSAAIDAALHWLEDANHHLLTLADAAYPQRLLDTPDPPTVLYVKGPHRPTQSPQPWPSSVRATQRRRVKPTPKLSRPPWPTPDSPSSVAWRLASMRPRTAAACGAQARTIAVIGTGIDRVYPARNQALARDIAAQGTIVSEFPLGTPALKENFPRRNRIISGLAHGLPGGRGGRAQRLAHHRQAGGRTGTRRLRRFPVRSTRPCRRAATS